MSLFSNVVGNRPKKHAFNLSHERKFSMFMGELVPILCEEIIPGDTWQMNTEVLMRFAPMLAPIMHRVNVFTHSFFVPNRLIWEDWEKFITGGADGNQMPVRPYRGIDIDSSWMAKGSLADFLGYATDQTTLGTTQVNALPFRAYSLIYNEYYRDQNLEDEIEIDLTSGEDGSSTQIFETKYRAWEKDYFTSALPWTQRGGDVTFPIGGSAPVVYNDNYTAVPKVWAAATGDPLGSDKTTITKANTGAYVAYSSSENLAYDPDGSLEADLSSATATTIEELRRATKLQQWLERNARGGSRYIEQILSHFGVISSDQRLQRPEFLGGGKTPVVISEVLQTSETTTESSPQGNMSGHALAAGNSHRFRKYFEEHGYIFTIMSVLPKTAYQQGTRRHLFKDDKFDYYFPEFAQLGEQPVYQAEIFDDYVEANRNETFGYQSRYAEYKHIPSSVHGAFKDDLSFWHMGRIFQNAPTLNSDFVKSNLSLGTINSRVFAAGGDDPQLWVQVYNNIKALRPIPKLNNPSLI